MNVSITSGATQFTSKSSIFGSPERDSFWVFGWPDLSEGTPSSKSANFVLNCESTKYQWRKNKYFKNIIIMKK